MNKITFKSFLESKYDPPWNVTEIKTKGMDYLLKDPVHLWRATTGIELIHKEPTVEELERIWKNWQLMSDNQKTISDKMSIKIFGMNNSEHFKQLSFS